MIHCLLSRFLVHQNKNTKHENVTPTLFSNLPLHTIRLAHSDLCLCLRTCLEVRCRDGSFTDNYGNKMDRSGLCLDKSKSVKVKVRTPYKACDTRTLIRVW